MITLGILGSRGKSTVGEILQREFEKDDKKVVLIGTKEDSTNEFFKLIYDDVDYAIVEISREDLLNNHIGKIKFDIIIQTALENESDEIISEIQSVIDNLKEKGYFIFNSDSIQNINFKCDYIYPITYGFNGKTTVTASSINDLEALSFSYCLQRAIFTIEDALVQPFEKPVKAEGVYDDISYYMAAYTCLLVLGIKF